MEKNDIAQQIRGFIIENYIVGRDLAVSDYDSFMERGLIDSTGVLELVGFVEATYGIRVDAEDLTPENLDSIVSVAGYIERKLHGGSRSDTCVAGSMAPGANP